MRSALPISCLSRWWSGLRYQAKLPLGNIISSWELQEAKPQNFNLDCKPNVAWADSSTGGRARKGNRGVGGNICGRQLGTWRRNMDSKPGKMWFWLSLKHQVKDVIHNALPVKQKLLRGGGGTGTICIATWSSSLYSLQRIVPAGNTGKSLSKSKKSCVKRVPSIAHQEASGFSQYTNSNHRHPLITRLPEDTLPTQFDKIVSSFQKAWNPGSEPNRVPHAVLFPLGIHVSLLIYIYFSNIL